eukprot:45188-Eustigmatos_ZCMA.PRE.1
MAGASPTLGVVCSKQKRNLGSRKWWRNGSRCCPVSPSVVRASERDFAGCLDTLTSGLIEA